MDNPTSEKKSSSQVPAVIVLLCLIILLGLGFLFRNIIFSFSGKNVTNSTFSTSKDISTSTVFEKMKPAIAVEPYIDSSGGFKIDIPKGWKVSLLKDKPIKIFGIYDATLGHSSMIVVSTIPGMGEIDYLNAKVQENAIKIMDTGIQKGSDVQAISTTLISTKRISSTTIDMVYNMTLDDLKIEMPARMVFTAHNMGFVFARLSPDDEDISQLKNVIKDSINSFKILPTAAASVPFPTVTQKPLVAAYQNITETTTYQSKRFNFTIQYPSHWDWVTNISNDTSYQNEGIGFTLNSNLLKGSSKLAMIGLFVQDFGTNFTLDQEVEIKLSNLSQKILVTRNLQIIPSTWPSDIKAEAFEAEGYSQMGDGTLYHQKYLWVIAQRGTIYYEFQVSVSPEDYNTIYPLALSILKSITIK